MHKNMFIQFAAVGVAAALITTLMLISGLFLLIQYEPQLVHAVLNTTSGEQSISQVLDAESRVIEAVRTASPAVVAITVSKNVPVYERYYERSPLRSFWGDYFVLPQIRQNGTELQEVGGGSGFLVSSDGYIVTNRHVVSDEDASYTVFTNDGAPHDAAVIARDTVLDVAIIKIDGEDFDHLSFADSESIQVGQTVIAIGNALAEFRNTVSVGIVSGLSRSIVAADQEGGMEALDQLIQTDAAINNGNSGGPLLNLNGEVIGVNVAVASGAENVGFALNGNNVKNIVASVKDTGRIIRPYLGVRYIPIDKELQEKNNLTVAHGVLVQRGATRTDVAVIPGSPADKAGIMENDVILKFDGVELDAEHPLALEVAKKQVDEEVVLTVFSKGKEKEVRVILEASPQS